MNDVVEKFHKFWNNENYSINQYDNYEEFLNNVPNKYSIFHPEDRTVIEDLKKSNEKNLKISEKIRQMINYANGLYDVNDKVIKNADLRPIIPQPAHFMALKQEELREMKIVVLTTNPGYTPRIEDDFPKDMIFSQQRMLNSLNGTQKYVPWEKPEIPEEFLKEENGKEYKDFIKKYWHYNHFVNAGHSKKPSSNSFKALKLFEDSKHDIMQIDYFPYQSKSSYSIPDCFVKINKNALKDVKLKSQIYNFELLKFMIKETKAVFICRKYDLWADTVGHFYKELLVDFEDRAFVFNQEQSVYLSITRIRSLAEQREIDNIIENSKSKKGDTYIRLKSLKS
ncbi:hypothetical protein ACYSNU_07095 [Enterococcus sp. LJL120]